MGDDSPRESRQVFWTPGVADVATKSSKSEVSWQQIVTAVAAAAGGAAWVSAVGSGVVALRLERAHLPVEPVVALMSAEHRFALGAGLLIAPLLAGLVGFLVDWAFAGERDGVGDGWRQVLAGGTVLLGAALAFVILRPEWETFLAEVLAVAAAVPLAFHFLHKQRRGRARDPHPLGRPDRWSRHSFNERLVVFLTVLGAAGAGAIIAEALLRSPSFDEARVTVRAPVRAQDKFVTGGYITSTDYSIVLTTRCEVIEAVPRDLVARITVGPGKRKATRC